MPTLSTRVCIIRVDVPIHHLRVQRFLRIRIQRTVVDVVRRFARVAIRTGIRGVAIRMGIRGVAIPTGIRGVASFRIYIHVPSVDATRVGVATSIAGFL